jgi:preprotein translocase subunit SecG
MMILLAIHVFVTVLLILIILIQKNDGGSSLFASGGSGNMLSARGVSNLLTKVTWALASVFLANCVLMATIASSDIKKAQTIIENREREEPANGDENSVESNDADNGEEETDNTSNPQKEVHNGSTGKLGSNDKGRNNDRQSGGHGSEHRDAVDGSSSNGNGRQRGRHGSEHRDAGEEGE